MKPRRNDPCPCGSGQKYKKCCGGKPAGATDIAPLAALMNAGRYAEAEAGARMLLERHPTLGLLWKLYGAALLFQDKEAVYPLQRSAQLLPTDAEAHFYLGNALHDRGDFEGAAAAFSQAVKLNPQFAEAHGNLGNALQELGRFDEATASYRRMLAIEPDVPEAHNSLGNALLALGVLEQAAASYREALTRRPDSVGALVNLANVLRDLGRPQEAMVPCRRALELRPAFADGHRTLGNIQFDLGQYDQAEVSYSQALTLQPDYAEAHAALGMLLRQMGRAEEAEQCCRSALAIQPDSAETLALLGEIHANKGLFPDAEQLFRRALALNPDLPEGWAGLARYRKMGDGDADWLTAVQRIVAKGLPIQHEINLRYAIGKYFDDVGEFDSAFASYRRANELTKRYGIAHDAGRLERRVQHLTSAYDHRWLSGTRGTANPSERPVFIVGMPRSGTSLAEQMLASHPAVFGAGELRFWHAASAQYEAAARAGQDPADVIARLASDYLCKLDEFSSGALRIVDKMPANTMNLGLIHAALPNARIIHMQRHPIDTCLSIYFQIFSATHAYAHDLNDLAHHYTQYRGVMQHWRAVLPDGAILDVPYEQLVQEPELWGRRMLSFIGLPWDSRCLDFHATQRLVLTASSWQVRQKIHKSSAGRWHNYESFVGPLRGLLVDDRHPL